MLLAAIQMAAIAEPKTDNGNGKGKDHSAAVYRIPDTDVRVVSEYWQGRSLPPGLQKKLRR